MNLWVKFLFFEAHKNSDCLSEWLRRWTRNPLGHARAGSNPAAVDKVFDFFVVDEDVSMDILIHLGIHQGHSRQLLSFPPSSVPKSSPNY
jgi:hypothetical protein